MGLPENLLSRANALLDDESRRIIQLQIRLEEETEKARLKQVELETKIQNLKSWEQNLIQENEKLQIEINKLKEGKTEEFLLECKQKQSELAMLMRKAEEALLIEDKKEKIQIIEEVQEAVKNVRIETEKDLVETRAEDIAIPINKGDILEKGTTVIVLDKGLYFGSIGIVSRRTKGMS
jgi:hypothetical protein